MPNPLRIGVLGASRISPISIVEPAMLTGARLVAVAARHPPVRKISRSNTESNGFTTAMPT
jgi:predicted homoserine dehydrogenase-like protein